MWSFNFVEGRTDDGRSLRIMTLSDEHSRECLSLKEARRIVSCGVIETLADAMLEKGVPEHVRCDNGPEMIAKALREWLAGLGTRPLYIEPGSPWENGFCESFNGKLQDACQKREIFYSLREAQVVIGAWKDHYNCIHPHSSLATGLPRLSPCTSSHASYPRQPPCSSLTEPGPKSRSGRHLRLLWFRATLSQPSPNRASQVT
jgi:transposase InsO family protein